MMILENSMWDKVFSYAKWKEEIGNVSFFFLTDVDSSILWNLQGSIQWQHLFIGNLYMYIVHKCKYYLWLNLKCAEWNYVNVKSKKRDEIAILSGHLHLPGSWVRWNWNHWS